MADKIDETLQKFHELVSQQIDHLRSHFDTRFVGLEDRMAGLEQIKGHFDTRFTGLERRIARIELRHGLSQLRDPVAYDKAELPERRPQEGRPTINNLDGRGED